MRSQSIPPIAVDELADIEAVDVFDRLSEIEREIQLLFERVPFGSHTLDESGTYQTINSLELAWLGYTRDEVVGKRKLHDFLTPPSQKILGDFLSAAGASPVFAGLELDLVRRDGSSMPVGLSSVARTAEDDLVLHHRVLMVDLSSIHQSRSEKLVSASAFESMSAMFVTDSEQNILQVNRAFSALTGYSAQEAVGKRPHILSSGRHDAAFYQAMWAALRASGSWQGEIWNRRKNGELYLESLRITAVVDAAGTVLHYVGSFLDITASKKAQDRIVHMTRHDELTQLPNRRLLQDRLDDALVSAQRSGLHGAILYVDLDNFKMINDTRGHETGDLLLVEAAKRLCSVVREGDTVARVGGDEFVVLLEALDSRLFDAAAKARQYGEKILETIAQEFLLEGYEYRCSASIGIDMFANAQSSSDLMQRADLALHESKKSGRGALRFFDPDMRVAVNSRVTMEADLRQALARHELALHFQPQLDSQLHLVGAEALLRWKHAERGMVSPAEFIPLAEETSLILPIGRWVLEAACAQLQQWSRSPKTERLQLAVNVSPRQFYQADFVATLTEVLAQSGINPSLIKLEVTEGMVLYVQDTIIKMNALRDLGVNFSMDDFGTGYSSLSILTKLPLKQLKIDQSFVQNIGIHASDDTIVKTIISMAENLGIEVIAEGVETELQRQFLASMAVRASRAICSADLSRLRSFRPCTSVRRDQSALRQAKKPRYSATLSTMPQVMPTNMPPSMPLSVLVLLPSCQRASQTAPAVMPISIQPEHMRFCANSEHR